MKTAAAADRRLEDYLRSRGHQGAAVEVLAGDASTRRYYRVSGPGLAAVVSVYPEPFIADELPFSVMQRLLLAWGIPTPRIEDEDPQRGIVVQQDLGDRMLQSVLADTPHRKVLALYKTAISDLARLQLEAGRGPQTAACFGVAFDIEKLSWELHYFVKHFLEGLRERDLGVGDRSALGESFHGLSAEIASWPQVLCHRDFHSRNLMLHEGLLYWIDFQDARMGPATYDLVSLLKDSYVDIEKGSVAELAEELSPESGAGRGARRLHAALRPDGDAAQPEGARHLRLHGHGARQSGLSPVRAAHPRAPARQPGAPPRAGRVAPGARAAHRRTRLNRRNLRTR